MIGDANPDLRLDRRAHPPLVDALCEGGALRRLVDFRDSKQELWDLQFRRKSGATSLVSLYGGMTSVLDLHVHDIAPEPQYRFVIQHPTHQGEAEDHARWAEWRTREQLARLWPQVKSYLKGREKWLLRGDGARHFIEGRVHALLSSSFIDSFQVIDREAAPSFSSREMRRGIIAEIRSAIDAQLETVVDRPMWLKPSNFDASPDFLAVGSDGRLLVIEAKPPESSAGIVKGPLQAAMYAALIATWLRRDPEAPELLHQMLRQRTRTGLTRQPVRTFEADTLIVPILAIGIGSVSPRTLDHCQRFRDALDGFQPGPGMRLEPVEIWRMGAVATKI